MIEIHWTRDLLSLSGEDDAPYHSVLATRTPFTSWRNTDIHDWLATMGAL